MGLDTTLYTTVLLPVEHAVDANGQPIEAFKHERDKVTEVYLRKRYKIRDYFYETYSDRILEGDSKLNFLVVITKDELWRDIEYFKSIGPSLTEGELHSSSASFDSMIERLSVLAFTCSVNVSFGKPGQVYIHSCE